MRTVKLQEPGWDYVFEQTGGFDERDVVQDWRDTVVYRVGLEADSLAEAYEAYDSVPSVLQMWRDICWYRLRSVAPKIQLHLFLVAGTFQVDRIVRYKKIWRGLGMRWPDQAAVLEKRTEVEIPVSPGKVDYAGICTVPLEEAASVLASFRYVGIFACGERTDEEYHQMTCGLHAGSFVDSFHRFGRGRFVETSLRRDLLPFHLFGTPDGGGLWMDSFVWKDSDEDKALRAAFQETAT